MFNSFLLVYQRVHCDISNFPKGHPFARIAVARPAASQGWTSARPRRATAGPLGKPWECPKKRDAEDVEIRGICARLNIMDSYATLVDDFFRFLFNDWFWIDHGHSWWVWGITKTKKGEISRMTGIHDEFYRPNRWVAHKNMVHGMSRSIWLIFGVTEAFGILRVDVSIKFGFSIVCFYFLPWMGIYTNQLKKKCRVPVGQLMLFFSLFRTRTRTNSSTFGTCLSAQIRSSSQSPLPMGPLSSLRCGWGWLGQGAKPKPFNRMIQSGHSR